jgi:hypothetical protein
VAEEEEETAAAAAAAAPPPVWRPVVGHRHHKHKLPPRGEKRLAAIMEETAKRGRVRGPHQPLRLPKAARDEEEEEGETLVGKRLRSRGPHQPLRLPKAARDEEETTVSGKRVRSRGPHQPLRLPKAARDEEETTVSGKRVRSRGPHHAFRLPKRGRDEDDDDDDDDGGKRGRIRPPPPQRILSEGKRKVSGWQQPAAKRERIAGLKRLHWSEYPDAKRGRRGSSPPWLRRKPSPPPPSRKVKRPQPHADLLTEDEELTEIPFKSSRVTYSYDTSSDDE